MEAAMKRRAWLEENLLWAAWLAATAESGLPALRSEDVARMFDGGNTALGQLFGGQPVTSSSARGPCIKGYMTSEMRSALGVTEGSLCTDMMLHYFCFTLFQTGRETLVIDEELGVEMKCCFE